MSRTANWSLKYFPLDSGFFEDKRIRRLCSRFGADGPMLYIYILCHTYGDKGYYLEYSDDWVEDAAQDLRCSTDKIELMLHYLLDKTLLDSTLFNTVKVLSSHGIQTQYQLSKRGAKQDIEVDARLWVLSESETAGFVKVRHFSDTSEKIPLISEKKELISEKKAAKESKVNKSKLKESKGKEESAERPFPPSKEDVIAFNKLCGNKADPIKFYEYYSERNWQLRGQPIDWKTKLEDWNKTEFCKRGKITTAANYVPPATTPKNMEMMKAFLESM